MQLNLFEPEAKTLKDISAPRTYKGLYSFHKYWGKKPTESISFFVENFTEKSDIILDPFLGSGLISREALMRERRFIGVDINPFSITHGRFLLDLPKPSDFLSALKILEKKTKQRINESYITRESKVASHFLWQNDQLSKVWTKPDSGRSRVEYDPDPEDIKKYNSFVNYQVEGIRSLSFFSNSRINSKKEMTIYDLFSRRALRNIDILIKEISMFPETMKRALMLTLTSSSGQMSSMVFAISGRGKTTGKVSEKIEVGSWVIGFWRPELHFEINVWNCFFNRAMKLYKALSEIDVFNFECCDSFRALQKLKSGAMLINEDCLNVFKGIEDNSIKLICTDPPHGDRIPYLELSEMWNAILNEPVSFEKEIVVSNAKERKKDQGCFDEVMKQFLKEATRILKSDGLMLIYYNGRSEDDWDFFRILESIPNLNFIGAFPMEYSATSVVQDNRKGALKSDFVLVIKKGSSLNTSLAKLFEIPGWTTEIPRMKATISESSDDQESNCEE